MKRALISLLIISFITLLFLTEEGNSENNKEEPWVPRHILVKPHSGLSDIRTVANRTGGELVRKFPGCGWYLLKLSPESDLDKMIRTLRKDSAVDAVEPDYIRSFEAIPNDPSFNFQWHLYNDGIRSGRPDADIDGPEAWEVATGDGIVVVAVIDTGINWEHEDLSDNIWRNGEEIPANSFDDDGNGYIDDVRGWDFRWRRVKFGN